MAIYVNRVLDLKKIKAIGFDMDHTLIRYRTLPFETLAFKETINKLVRVKHYPQEILSFQFDFNRVTRGLVIDRELGNLLKLSLHGKVKKCFHGYTPLTYRETTATYKSLTIDLRESRYGSIDTTFSISAAALYQALVDFKDKNRDLFRDFGGSYAEMALDIMEMIDLSHMDGSLKTYVRSEPKVYLEQDEKLAQLLERLKQDGKKLMIITNSDFHYTRLLMEFAINPYLKSHKSWLELFDLTITQAEKPRFFTDKRRFLKVNTKDGSMSNWVGPLTPGVFQGGMMSEVQSFLGLDGESILYLGDHIYGDILKLKHACNWRTAMVVEEIEPEVETQKQMLAVQQNINALMIRKEALERELNQSVESDSFDTIYPRIKTLDNEIGHLVADYEKRFNPYWGPVMRAGQEPSLLAMQIERYACIYMSRISELADYSSKHYFRPKMRALPHDVEVNA